MIIAQIKGGLGNQLFILAISQYIADSTRLPLFIETRSGFFHYQYKWQYELKHLMINENNSSWLHSLYFIASRKFPKLSKFVIQMILGKKVIHIKDKDVISDKLLKLFERKNVIYYLDDYFQIHQPLINRMNILREEFRWKNETSLYADFLFNRIKSTESVCLHLRLMRNYDALGNEINTTDEKQLDSDYFEKAIVLLNSIVSNPTYFIFSDNIQIAKSFLPNLETMNYHFVENSNKSNMKDFTLMKKCNHFIISNSSFSWWSAMLSKYRDKKVISPPLRFWDNINIIPPQWIILEDD